MEGCIFQTARSEEKETAPPDRSSLRPVSCAEKRPAAFNRSFRSYPIALDESSFVR